MSESVLNFLEEKNLPEVTKKKHTYLLIDGHDQEYKRWCCESEYCFM